MNNTQNTNKPADKIWADGTSIKARNLKFGQVLGLGINVDKFITFLNKYKNAKGYVNLDIMERKQVGTYGETHNCSLDTWVPNANKIDSAQKTQTVNSNPPEF